MGSGTFLDELTGSMSQGAAGNPTVAVIEAAYRHHELPWRYINMEVAPADLGEAVRGAKAMGFRGFNLSMPHKVSVIPLLTGLGQSASLIGAVNCVVLRDGEFVGENTDGKGFLTSLQSVTDPRGKRVVMFGAGGAARAVSVELALGGASQITVVNRNAERGRELVQTLREKAHASAEFVEWAGDYRVPPETEVLINATSIGLYDGSARLAIEAESLQRGLIVADVVFNPSRTRLLREAEERGCIALDGLGMLVNQAVIGVQYWTGITPDAAVMRKTLEQSLLS